MSFDFRSHKLNKNQARKLISNIANNFPSHIRFSRHAIEELKKDKLTTSDALNVIKSKDSKILSDPELEHGSYRYRLETSNIMVVISFDSDTSLVVVTAWRRKK